MSDGSYSLVGYPQSEPATFATRKMRIFCDGGLGGAFGNPKYEIARENGDSNGTAVPGNGALDIKKAQP